MRKNVNRISISKIKVSNKREPKRLNELTNFFNDRGISRNGGDEMNQSVRFVSMIDSRPVQPPYLSLVPYKSFTNGERSLNAAGLDGSTATDQKSKANIQWNKLLSEDLEELLKQKMAEHLEMLKRKQEI
jgi:hypothetical protein